MNRYPYLYNGLSDIPEIWEPIILNMLEQIDKIIKPKLIPRFFINRYWQGPTFEKISQKFGTLRVKHNFTDTKIREIIFAAERECNKTCEICGTKDSSLITIKNWVYNLCQNCKDTLKNVKTEI